MKTHPLSASSLKKIKLNRGYIKKLDKMILEERDTMIDSVISNFCNHPKPCKMSRMKCCKSRGLDMTSDRKIMRSLEQRYDSFIQTMKNNDHNIPLYSKYNYFRP